MNRLVALVLLFAVPAFAQQQVSLLPSAEQPDPEPAAAAVQDLDEPTNWKPIIIAGSATVVAAVVLAIVVMVAIKPNAPLKQSDFMCNGGAMGCDAWINQPSP